MWHRYFTPNELGEALSLLQQYGASARIVAGGTDLVLDFNSDRCPPVEALLDISNITELKQITLENDLVHIGSAVTFSQILKSDLLLSYAPLLVDAVRTIAGPQIRNIATIGGNVVNASPAADTIPPLLVLDTVVSIARPREMVRRISLDKFLLGNRKVDLQSDEIVTGIDFPLPHPSARYYFRKVQPRQSMAIAILSLALLLQVQDNRIADARIALGSVAPTAVRVKSIEQGLRNLPITSVTEPALYTRVKEDIAPISDFRASLTYRLEVAEQLLQESITSLLDLEIDEHRMELSDEA
jgi:carbon-monoxide dehydrogenase medium subunit